MTMRQFVRNFGKRNSFTNPRNRTTTYMEAMYNAWLRDPSSVHRSWDAYFRNSQSPGEDEDERLKAPGSKNRKPLTEARSTSEKVIDDHVAVCDLIRKYQTRGYRLACLDPLAANLSHYPAKEMHDELNFLTQDWDREFRLPSNTRIGGKERNLVLKEIAKRLEQIYCRRIGVEYMFIENVEHRNWIRDRFEVQNDVGLEPEEQRKVLIDLSRAVGFERFLASHFTAYKNYSLAGCEVLIPGLEKLIDVSSGTGVKSVILGSTQRGRLNIFANVCKKSIKEILSLFNETQYGTSDDLGDLKYSLGTVVERTNGTITNEMRISVIASPINSKGFVPIVLGKAFAEQIIRGDYTGTQVMPVIIHDDAALYGQGIALEALQLSKMPNYITHGTIHIVLNTLNTQYPLETNSSTQSNTPNPLATQYCRNISRTMDAPILHVNADDPDAVMHVFKIAAEWRDLFRKDIVIQLVGYRRTENNCDVFSDPKLCYKIKEHMTCLEKYTNKLIKEKLVFPEDAKMEIVNFEDVCRTSLELAKILPFDSTSWQDGRNTEITPQIGNTGVKVNSLVEIGRFFLLPPKNDQSFVLSKALYRILSKRQEMLDKGVADWTLAEALAFGSLIKRGIPVRLSIQAPERDAFIQRHHLLYHQLVLGKIHNSLEDIYPKQAPYTISYNSLSESAVLGFEHGYSLANPNTLVIWEAPSGDFSCSTQLIIDQYIATGQSKWGHQSGLVLLLPYGLEPDKSSTRLERFLQMCSDDPDTWNNMDSQLEDINWIVANCTVPANYFHILRRQVAFSFRKPLVLMVSKLVIQHGEIKSYLTDMGKHSEFQPIILENLPEDYNPATFKKLIFCSGQIYYDLARIRAEKQLEDDIAIIRVEQIAPFPYNLLRTQIEHFENAEIVWVQEEQKNQGAWTYVRPRFQTIISDSRDISYIGRPCNGLTANKSKDQYNSQFQELLEEAMLIQTDFTRFW